MTQTEAQREDLKPQAALFNRNPWNYEGRTFNLKLGILGGVAVFLASVGLIYFLKDEADMATTWVMFYAVSLMIVMRKAAGGTSQTMGIWYLIFSFILGSIVLYLRSFQAVATKTKQSFLEVHGTMSFGEAMSQSLGELMYIGLMALCLCVVFCFLLMWRAPLRSIYKSKILDSSGAE